MNKILTTALILVGSLAVANQALAFACYEDPIYERDWHGSYDIAAFVRDNPCVDGTTILETVAQGTVVEINGETDGWYRVITPNGVEGWTGSSLMSLTSDPITEGQEGSEGGEGQEGLEGQEGSGSSQSFAERVAGQILLQVEEHGEAWYVFPDTGKRYYMKDGPTAYEMMRSFGLGITNSDLDKLPYIDSTDEMNSAENICGSNAMAARLAGQILLQVEELGEAWYVYPDTCQRIYLKDGDAAYTIMRYLGLGITNSDLEQITDGGEIEIETVDQDVGAPHVEPEVSDVGAQHVEPEIAISSYQEGTVPSGIDLMEANEYWLDEINDLRAAAGLRELVLDQRFIDSATDWAAYEGEVGYSTHTRPDGSSMHDWIDEWGFDWTERYSENGWSSNYFTENISWNYVSGTTESMKDMMDQTIDWMLAEASYNGAHYRSIYHEDWNTVGTGMYFEPNGSSYKVYLVIHYGSLEI